MNYCLLISKVKIVILFHGAIVSVLSSAFRVLFKVTEVVGEVQADGSSAELEFRLLVEGIVPSLRASFPGVEQVSHGECGR